jgi:hypothetical protein
MRVYVREAADVALQVIKHGWWDMHTDAGQLGVWCNEAPPTGVWLAAGRGIVMGGPEGNVVLCTDVPEELFREMEAQEGTRQLTEEEARELCGGGPGAADMEYQRMGYAIIPAEVLNRQGKPQVYDHDYAGCSRKDLVRGAEKWEAGGVPDKAREMRAAMEFFDKIGWLTPVKAREEGAS